MLDNGLWGLLPPQDDSLESSTTSSISNSAVSRRPPASLFSEFRDEVDEELTAYRADRGHVRDRVPEVPHDNNWLWHLIFEQLDPLQITLVGSVKILSSLLSRDVDLASDWACNSHRHIVSLSRTSRSSTGQDNQTSVALLPSQKPRVNVYTTPSDLFSIRDWTALLVNEGSFTPVYSHHQVTTYLPPTLLPTILNSSDTSFNHIHKTLQSFSYIGIFPISGHIREVIVPCLPPVEHLFLQMTPQASNFFPNGIPILGEIADLWLEFDTAYSVVMRELFDREVKSAWKELKAFESGDAANEEAWSMAMQYVQVHGLKGWKMKRKGYFVRKEDRL